MGNIMKWANAFFVLLTILFISGCVGSREFFKESREYTYENREAKNIMEKLVENCKVVYLEMSDTDKDSPASDRMVYGLYVKADTTPDGLITQQEAEKFKAVYVERFNKSFREKDLRFMNDIPGL